MTSFFINLWSLLRATLHGIKRDEEFRALLILLTSLLAGATYFYWRFEGWSVVDALYFSVMTMSTVGYGDLVPTTTFTKLFTIIFTIMSIGVFVAAVGKLVTIILEDKRIRKQKRLNKLSDKNKVKNKEKSTKKKK